tara:strand:+ start:4256 stop:4717 length:462 start_codon:yes stop_codon:yes gene_type:complete
MRLNEFRTDEEQLDEILPLIGAAVGGLARAGVAAAGGVARAAGGVAKGVGKAVAGGVAKGVGSAIGAATPPAKSVAGAEKQEPEAIERAKDQMIKPGQTLQLPTQGTGGPSDFKITRIQGNEVEIENPEGVKQPNQPSKVVYKKDDLKKSMVV